MTPKNTNPLLSNNMEKITKTNPKQVEIERIVTHSGKSHLDEVVSIAILKDLFPDQLIKYSRTRDSKAIQQAVSDETTLVVDVGLSSDENMNNYDHHQKDFSEQRQEGVKYAASGLIWKKYGKEWIKYVDAMLRQKSLSESEISEIWSQIDREYIKVMDMNDNGDLLDFTSQTVYGERIDISRFTMSEIIRGFNQNNYDGKTSDQRFEEAVNLYRTFLLSILNKKIDLMISLRNFDESQLELGNNGRTLIVKSNLSPELISYVIQNYPKYSNVEFFANPSSDNKYFILPVPVSENSRIYRNNNMIPKQIRLVNDQKTMSNLLGLESGVEFVHTGGFTARCGNLEATKKFLDYCIQN